MTELPALITAVDARGIRIRIQHHDAVCDSCSGVCSLKWLPLLQKFHGPDIHIGKTQLTLFRQQTLTDVQTGDRILLGFREEQLLLGSIAVYCMPLFMFFLAIYLAKITIANEPATIFAGFAGLFAGLLGLKLLDRSRYCHWWWPVTLRRCSGDDVSALAKPY